MIINYVVLISVILSIYIYIYIYKSSKVNLATAVESELKDPFSLATTSRSRGGRHSIPWIAPLYSRFVIYNAEC